MRRARPPKARGRRRHRTRRGRSSFHPRPALPRPLGTAPHTKTGHSHGDPFPLPSLGCEASLRRGGPRERSIRRRTSEAISSLNRLDAPRSVADPDSLGAQQSVLTASQFSIVQRLDQRIRLFGLRPTTRRGEALAQLLKAKDLYSATPTPVRPYDPDKLSLLHDRLPALPLRPRLSDEGRQFYDQAHRLIVRTPREVELLSERTVLETILTQVPSRAAYIRLLGQLAVFMGLLRAPPGRGHKHCDQNLR